MDVPERPHIEPSQISELDPKAAARMHRVERAVHLWKGELVDLGGRNTLLYYRDLKQGTLDLGTGNRVAVEELLASKTLHLSTIFSDPEALPAAAKRARTIRAKAKEMFEERGLKTLSLAWGMATWTNRTGAATPAAPILLREATLAARGGAQEDFDLALIDEYEPNPTLLHFLRTEFSVELPPEELVDLLEDSGGDVPDARAVLERVTKACADVEGFAVVPRIVLGNFSYAKLPMVKDLEASLDALVASDLIAAIAGDEDARQALRDRHPTDISVDDPDRTPLADEFLVLDADSSQNYVINAVLRGADLVVEGPPGTGKSQTIANLIATLVARGRSVLFVAEKRAAIDAVTNRLDKQGLSDLVLDLHEGAGSRKRMAEDLGRTMARAALTPAVDVSALSRVEIHRADLDRYVKAMHARRDPWRISLFEARANCMGVPDHLRTVFRWHGEELAQIGGDVFGELAQIVDEFVVKRGPELLTRDGSSAWSAAARGRTIVTPDLVEEAFDCARQLGEVSLPGTLRLLNVGAEATGMQPGRSLAGWQECVLCWEQISALLPKMDPGIFGLPLNAVVDAMRPASGGFIRRALALCFRGGYRRARRSLKQVVATKLTSAALLTEAVAARDAAAAWATFAVTGSPPAVPADLRATATSFHQTVQAAERLSVLGAFDAVSMATPDLLDLCADLVADRETLNALPVLARMQSQLERLHVMPLVSEVGLRSLSPDEAKVSLSYAWWSSVHEHVSSSDSTISGFRRQAHDREAAQYLVGDEEHIVSTAARVLRAVAERSVQVRNEYPAESDLVLKQARLRRGHLPIRDLFQAARHVLTAIKPCWAMSPLVVSQLLPNERDVFNVVIFDEASQITPADAVGPLLRATQAVVAGDRRQLPPTSFFIADTPDAEDEQDDQGALTKNLESVLDVMASLLPAPNGTRTLEWHYRSRDERLIAFSNAQPMLYDWSLTTFPGVTEGGCLEHVLVEWDGATGQEESSSPEVEQVVQLVLRHAAERPEESLGVIAMGIKHADRISESLRRARSETVEADEFFAEDRDEPFFVKNLERVQGDERDAIILSVGYGKGADGRMYYRFGPLNTAGGERRLNVAITRAKRRLTVVSSFSVSDLDPTRLRSEGAQMLQRYLAYAQSGGEDLGRLKRHKPELNPFERDVLHHLTAAGIPLIPQYGVSGYWIDFAAQHPTQPGRMVLAIEADGAMYHSAKTVRDRDRLRQQHLERLGWRFHRIWSTEWFLHREQEIERAVDAYHEASSTDGVAPTRERNHLDRVPTPPRGPRPPVPKGLGINDYSDRQLDAIVGWISSDTLARTRTDLLQAVMQELAFERKGQRIVERLMAAIERASLTGG